MKNMKRITSMLLSIVMVLSLAVGCMITTSAGEEEPAQKVWTPDAEWIANFNATKGTATEFAINDEDDLYAFWAVTLKSYTDLETYTVSTGAESRAATKGKTFYLTADLDLEGANWPGICDFSGSFDGRGHKITNWVQEKTVVTTGNRTKNAGFFWNIGANSGETTAADIFVKNLVLEGNVMVNYPDGQSAGQASAGILAGAYANKTGSLTIENVLINGDITFTGTGDNTQISTVAGVIGYHSQAGNTLTIKNTLYKGTVTANAGEGEMLAAAAFIGGQKNVANTQTITNCLNLGTVVDGAKGGTVTTARWNAYEASTSQTIENSVDATAEGVTANYDYLVANNLTATWVEDETYGILPAALADAIYPLYLQQSLTPDENGKYSIRILAPMNTMELNSMDFDVKILRGTVTETTTDADWMSVPVPTQKKVYTAVLAAGEKVSASVLGGKYLCGVVLTDIPAGETVTIKVTPTRNLKDGETTQASTIAYQTVVTFPSAS